MVQFADIPQGAGSFFKPADHESAIAILVEPKRFERDRPGKFGPRDAMHADVAVFNTQAELDEGAPVVMPATIIQGAALVRDLEPLTGNATVVSLDFVENKKGTHPIPVWKPASPVVKKKVVEYVTKREAEFEAAQESMPDYLS